MRLDSSNRIQKKLSQQREAPESNQASPRARIRHADSVNPNREHALEDLLRTGHRIHPNLSLWASCKVILSRLSLALQRVLQPALQRVLQRVLQPALQPLPERYNKQGIQSKKRQRASVMMVNKYGFAIVAALVAALLTAILWTFIAEMPFIIVFGAVILSAWRGGFLAGMTTALIGFFAIKYYLFEPRYEFVGSFSDAIQLLFYLMLTGFISWLEETHKQTEQALRNVKDELETILNGVTDGITAQDADGNVVFANSASALISGQHSRAAILETPIAQLQRQFELLDENGNPMPYSDLPRHKVFATRLPSEITLQRRTVATDERRWLHLKSTPVLDKYGDVRLAVNIFRDITERRQMMDQRQESEMRLRKVLDNLATFVAVLTPDGNVLEVNHPALEVVQMKAEDLTGKPLNTLSPLAYSEAMQQKIGDAVARAAKGETCRFDIQVLAAPDQFLTVDFMLAPVYDGNKVLQYLIASGVDITERLRREQEILNLTVLIEAQRRRLDLIISNVPGIVYERTGSLDASGERSNFISSHVETMLGYSPQEWENDLGFWEKIIHPDDRAVTFERVAQVAQSGTPAVIPVRCYTKDGNLIHVEAHFGVMRGEDGSYSGICGVMTDVTERKQQEENLFKYTQELARSNEELERSNEELGQFVYVASHDLQEPLRMVTSYLQLIENRYKANLDATGHEFINYAVEGATRMKTLINDLLAYSRLSRSKMSYEQINMEASTQMAMHHLQLSIADNKAEITYDPLPEIMANESQMIQLLQQLLGNAIKFHSETAPKIHVSCKQDGDDWLFSVRDNGIGIESPYLDRIFVIFQRLHTRESYTGTGIGLAICKKIVELHDGRIWAESQPGIGSIFSFTIPVTHRKKDQVKWAS